MLCHGLQPGASAVDRPSSPSADNMGSKVIPTDDQRFARQSGDPKGLRRVAFAVPVQDQSTRAPESTVQRTGAVYKVSKRKGSKPQTPISGNQERKPSVWESDNCKINFSKEGFQIGFECGPRSVLSLTCVPRDSQQITVNENFTKESLVTVTVASRQLRRSNRRSDAGGAKSAESQDTRRRVSLSLVGKEQTTVR